MVHYGTVACDEIMMCLKIMASKHHNSLSVCQPLDTQLSHWWSETS